MAGESHVTTNHAEIRRWMESRGGRPAAVKATAGKDDPGILRVNFPGYGAEASLEEIDWEEFFHKFEESQLAFLYQEQTKSGDTSRFFKFVKREGMH